MDKENSTSKDWGKETRIERKKKRQKRVGRERSQRALYVNRAAENGTK